MRIFTNAAHFSFSNIIAHFPQKLSHYSFENKRKGKALLYMDNINAKAFEVRLYETRKYT